MEFLRLSKNASIGVAPEKYQRMLNSYRFCLLTGSLMLIIGILTLMISFRSGANTLPSILVFIVVFGAFTGALIARLGRPELGIGLLLSCLFVLAIIIPFISPGSSIPSAILLLIMVSAITNATLTSPWNRYAILLSLIIGISTILTGLYSSLQRDLINPIGVYVVVAILGLIYGSYLVRQFTGFTVRTKLTTTFVLVAVIPIIILSIVNNVRTSNELNQNAQKNLEDIASTIARIYDTFIQNELDAIRVAAQIRSFIIFLTLSPDQRPDVEKEASQALLSLSRKDPTFVISYALLDRNGIDILDTNTDAIGSNQSNNEYFQNPIQTGLPFVSSVYKPEFDERMSLFFSAPVRNDRREIIGVMRVQYNANILQELMVSSVPQQSNLLYAVLLDDGYLIRLAHSTEPGLLYESYANLDAELVANLQKAGRLKSGSINDVVTFQPEFVDAINQLKASKQTGYFQTTSAVFGEAASSSAVHLVRAPWVVTTQQPIRTILEPVKVQTRYTVTLAILAAILVAVIALFVTQQLSAPIVRLTEGAYKVASGDLSVRATVEAKDEIGVLAETFNLMTEQLQQTLQNLELRVEERTRAIELSADVSRRISTILNPIQLVAEVVSLVQSAFNYYHVHVYLLDKQKGELVMAGGTGEAGRTMLDKGHSIPLGRGLVGRAADQGAIILAPETTNEPDWLPNPLLPETQSELAVPISVGDDILGVLDVQHNIPGGLKQQDADVLLTIANQVGIALRNAQQYLDAQRQAAREADLARSLSEIQSAQSVEKALQISAREIGRRTKSAMAMVRLSDEFVHELVNPARTPSSSQPDGNNGHNQSTQTQND